MDVAAFLNHTNRLNPRSKAAQRVKKKTPIQSAVADAEIRASRGDWSTATSRSFVGLYAFCHLLTYRVPDHSLEEKPNFQAATKLATRVLHKHFDDEKADLVEFIKWVWERERGREEWAAREGNQRGRLNVRIVFSSSTVTDYRVDQSRRKGRRR